MVILLGFRWWYSAGWAWIFNNAITLRVNKWVGFFSMPTLLKTMFAPFKQNYGKSRKGGIDALVQIAIDNSVSRIIGFTVRSFLLMAGLICLFFVLLSGLIAIALWPLVPALPIISILLATEAIP